MIMLKKATFLFFTSLCFLHSSDFLTVKEYGKMLFERPRSVSCAKCHRENAKGGLIGSFENKKSKQQEIYAPSLHGLDFKRFNSGVNHKNNFVPRYFLTENEIVAIYEYIRNIK